ncbi:hypothetical protein PILCRDRAFT_8410 [Piloderma croceum F 1598]|uniref:Uncharacterized protein n=1 Tax=Piloderma croceum (strain F 1598) TaxID=765440 RepID=A0A0C3B661_PILCF|nr:hypothetical protein PILCRDRAFT_8410 [Piloderma croceum F 1598]
MSATISPSRRVNYHHDRKTNVLARIGAVTTAGKLERVDKNDGCDLLTAANSTAMTIQELISPLTTSWDDDKISAMIPF